MIIVELVEKLIPPPPRDAIRLTEGNLIEVALHIGATIRPSSTDKQCLWIGSGNEITIGHPYTHWAIKVTESRWTFMTNRQVDDEFVITGTRFQ